MISLFLLYSGTCS